MLHHSQPHNPARLFPSVLSGFSTLFSNLMRSITTSSVAPSLWEAEYKHGSGLEVYTACTPRELIGRMFSELVVAIYRRFGGAVIVWGVLDETSTEQLPVQTVHSLLTCPPLVAVP